MPAPLLLSADAAGSAAVTTTGQAPHARQIPRLSELAILRDFEMSDRLALADAGTTLSTREGEHVIVEGEQHDAVLIVLAGRFRVTRAETTVAEIGVGQICGEMEMLNPPHSTASVTALSDAWIWRITRTQLRTFMERNGRAGQTFMKLLTATFAARLSAPGL